MLKTRLINVLVAVVLMVVLALTVQDAFATAGTVSRSNNAAGVKSSICASLPDNLSIHAQYVKEMGRWVTFTENGPTGVDGGLIYLESISRICSQ